MQQNMRVGSRDRVVRLTTAVAVVALLPVLTATTTHAQTATAAAPAPEPLETVEVTGSRIQNSDAASANPITVVGQQEIQQEEASTVEKLLMKVPSVDFTGGIAQGTANGGVGASELGLRNLAPQRTLVLVNGVRYPFTDTQGSVDAVDFNNFPVSMIDSIDILRDGASSLYGADAIAGVVNVKTKQNFQGVEVGSEYGITSYGDSQRYSVYSMVGANIDKGNILIDAEYSHQDPTFDSARSWATTQHPEADFNYFDGISSRITGAIGVIGGENFYFTHGLNSGIPAANAPSLCKVNLGDGFCGGGGLTPGDVAGFGSVYFDILPAEALVIGLERKSVNFTSHYDIFPGITATLEAFYTDRQSQEQLNPEPTGYNTPTPQFVNGLYIPALLPNGALNPYNPTNNAAFLAANGLTADAHTDVPILTRRFENGDRQYSDDINTYRLRAALNGSLLDNYEWEAGYFYGQSSATYRVANETNFYHLSQELGMNACGTEVGCSVANFLGYNTLTPAQAAYLSYTNTDTSVYELSDAYGNISGSLYTLPAGDLKFASGFEYKTDHLSDNPDAVTAAGDGATYSTPTSGGYATASGYAEMNIPLLKDLPFAKTLTLDASGRYDYNTTFGNALTHKEGLDWALDDNFRLRGSHSTGFRAPQVKELYGGHFLTDPSGSDPCAAGGAYAGSPACIASLKAVGLPANTTIQQINQLSEVAGGNPQLKPETSQSWSAGGVFTPTFLPDFSLAVDYYTILVRGEIGSLDGSQILGACYGNVPYVVSSATACSLIGPRNKLTGSLGQILTLNGNISDENTDGIDIDMNYSMPTEAVGLPAWGKILLNGQANYLLSDDSIGVGGFVQQQAGTFTGENGEPRWKALVGATFINDDWTLNFNERYYGGIRNSDPTSACEYGSLAHCSGTGKGIFDYEGNEAAGVFYSDISASYRYKTVRLTVGVDNLFDKDPPFLEPAVQANFLSTAGYDPTGRLIYMKAVINFGAAVEPSPAVPAVAPLPPPPAPVVAPAPEKQREFQVFFDFDKSNITEAAASVIKAAADVVKSGGVAHITVTGHTDTVGSAKYNQALSERRAAAVKAAMVSDGVDGGEISTLGVGKTGLLVPTADGVREPQNRRAVIQLQ